MKLNFLNKIISVSLIIIMVSHITIMHNLIKDYVLCKGADGHVAVENINECTSCSNASSFIILAAADENISEDDCEDTLLDDNCINDSIFIPKNKIKLNVYIAYASETIAPINNNIYRNNKLFEKAFYKTNLILNHYTTVSLLI